MNLQEGVIGRIDTRTIASPTALLTATIVAALLAYVGLFIGQAVGAPTPDIDAGIWLLAAPIALAFGMLAWLNERIWICCAVAAHLAFMMNVKNVGIGPGELFFLGVTLFGLAIWLFKEVVVFRRRIVSSGFDYLLMSYLILSTIVTFLANRLHHGPINLYLNEWAVSYDLLLYFPLKKFLRDRSDVNKLMVAFAFVAVLTCITGVMNYQSRIAQAVMAWQLEGARIFANEPTAMALMIMSATGLAYTKRKKWFVIWLAGFAIGALYLVVTFSRGAIVAGAVGIVAIVLFSPMRQRVRLSVIMLSTIAFGIIGISIAFPRIADTFYTLVENRLSTVAAVGQDMSFMSRVREAEAVLYDYVPYSPVIGYGYGTKFVFREPIGNVNHSANFIHNGYVAPLYKLGIPLTFVLFGLMLYPLIRLLVRRPKFVEGGIAFPAMMGGIGYLVAMLVLNYVSNQFVPFWCALNIVCCWAFLDFANRSAYREEEQLHARPAGHLEGRV